MVIVGVRSIAGNRIAGARVIGRVRNVTGRGREATPLSRRRRGSALRSGSVRIRVTRLGSGKNPEKRRNPQKKSKKMMSYVI